jgi:transcriptional regulator with XRE-family HTH domain
MTSPGRDELARALRNLIDAAGLVPAEVARRAGISEATMSRYLNKKVVPSPAAVRKIVTAAGQGGTDDAQQAVQLAEDLRAGAARRVVLLRSGTATAQKRFAEIEAEATHVASFTPLIVPGLLQTEAYARAVFTSGGQSGPRLEENLRGRIEQRQKLLDDPDHRFTQIVTEGALRWHAGGPAVMAEQVEHIAHRARLDTGGRVQIGIIPWSTPVDLFPLTNFDLYDDERAVIVGTNFGTNYLDRPLDVAVYVRMFQRLRELAVFGDAAVAEIERIAGEYRALPAR